MHAHNFQIRTSASKAEPAFKRCPVARLRAAWIRYRLAVKLFGPKGDETCYMRRRIAHMINWG